MIKLYKKTAPSVAVLIALSLSGCSAFETRMQANGSFTYQDVKVAPTYQSGRLSTDEARSEFALPKLTPAQQQSGLLSKDVDLRPPTQLIPVMEGVFLAADEKQQTKIVFNAFKQNEDISVKVKQLLVSFLAENEIEIISNDSATQQIETSNFSRESTFGGFLNSNKMLRESKYRFTLEKQPDGNSIALYVNLLSYSESNAGNALKLKLSDKNKKSVELRFVNDLLEFAYNKQEAEQLNELDAQPLAIKLGFDDNHQIAWLVENDFLATWKKLPALFSLLSFDIDKADSHLGLFSVTFDSPDDDYWAENKLNSFTLADGPYFVQLGELTGGNTSLIWLDEEKKPLADQKVTEIYLSITEQVRNVLLLNDKQTKSF